MSKISELSDGGALQSTDYLIAVRSGGNVKVQADGDLTLGSLTLDGLSIGTSTQNETLVLGASDSGSNFLQITNSTTTAANNRGLYVGIDANENARIIHRENADMFFQTNDTVRMQIDATGDISFYEDTGTTAKFFWDASAEALGIGTSSPDTALHVSSSSGTKATFERTGATGSYIGLKDSSGSFVYLGGNSGVFEVQTPGSSYSTKLAITSAGNVGIGETSPLGKLHIKGSDTGATASAQGNSLVLEDTENGLSILSSTAGAGYINFGDSDDNNIGVIVYDHSSNSMRLWTNASERLRIDSSGTLQIGTFSGNNVVQISAGTTGVSSLYLGDGSSGAASYAGFVEYNHTGDYLRLGTGSAEAARIDSSGNVGIGTSSPATPLHVVDPSTSYVLAETTGTGTSAGFRLKGDASADYTLFTTQGVNQFAIYDNAASAERMRIDASGNLLVGTTDTTLFNNTTGGGVMLSNSGSGFAKETSGAGDPVVYFNNTGDDGQILDLRKDGTSVGSIGSTTSDGGSRRFAIGGDGDSGIVFGGTGVLPAGGITTSDNAIDLGSSSYRFDDVYATNGTIQTSDRNEKENIRELLEAEARVAQAAKGLLRAFQWKDSVAEKGDDARIHFGIIAQDLQAAFEAEGLDAGRYAMFIHSTWTDEETGEERSRMGVRYSELLAFIIAAL